MKDSDNISNMLKERPQREYMASIAEYSGVWDSFLEQSASTKNIRSHINAFFSYNETIDIYHAVALLQGGFQEPESEEGDIPQSEPKISVKITPRKAYVQPRFEGVEIILQDEQELFRLLDKCQEGLEMAGAAQKQSMYTLFLLQMGLYQLKSSPEFNQYSADAVPFDLAENETRVLKSRYVSALLCTFPREYSKNISAKNKPKLESTGCLFSFSQIAKSYLQKLAQIDREKLHAETDGFIDLEFEVKISLNNLFLLIANNYEVEEFRDEFTCSMYSIEYNSFLAIKLSLDLPIVPIKKCLIIFYLYLSCLFGPPKALTKEKKFIRLTNNLREHLKSHENLGDKNPIEEFYKR